MRKVTKKFVFYFFYTLGTFIRIPVQVFLYFLVYPWCRPIVYYENAKAFSRDRKPDKPVILTPNHLAGSDGALMLVLFHKVRVTVLMEEFWHKFFFWFIGNNLTVSVSRSCPGVRWIHECEQKMNKGRSIVIFPEGYSEKDNGELQKFKPGYVMLSERTGADIIPIYIEGNYLRPFFNHFRIMIGEPMQLSEKDGLSQREYYYAECRRLQGRVEELKALLHERMAEEDDEETEEAHENGY